MNTENQISTILKSRGFKHVQPTDELLDRLNCTNRKFFKVLDNKIELTLTEAAKWADWLGVAIEELTTSPTTETHNLGDKFGLKQ